MTWQTVNLPVEAKVGEIHLRLFPYESLPDGPEGTYERPWAWGALCRITFRFGSRVTTKRLTQRFAYCTSVGWARTERPSDTELAAGREAVLSNLINEVHLHGIGEFVHEIVEDAA